MILTSVYGGTLPFMSCVGKCGLKGEPLWSIVRSSF